VPLVVHSVDVHAACRMTNRGQSGIRSGAPCSSLAAKKTREKQMSEGAEISRRRLLSVMGMAALVGLAGPTVIETTDAEAQGAGTQPGGTPPPTGAPPQTGMERREERREGRREGRHERREGRHERRHERREGRHERRHARRKGRHERRQTRRTKRHKPQAGATTPKQ
jgi:hypothetical protein